MTAAAVSAIMLAVQVLIPLVESPDASADPVLFMIVPVCPKIPSQSLKFS